MTQIEVTKVYVDLIRRVSASYPTFMTPSQLKKAAKVIIADALSNGVNENDLLEQCESDLNHLGIL